MANWDLLRSMSMFLVLVIHSTAMLGSVFHGDRIPTAINETLLVCDPVFFCLSGKNNCPCRDKAPSSCAIDPRAFFVISALSNPAGSLSDTSEMHET